MRSHVRQFRPAGLRRVHVLPLELALPGSDVRPIGIIVLDIATNRVFCKVDCSVCDVDTSEVISCVADDLISKAAEQGGAAVLRYLEDTLSNVLRVGQREQVYVQDPSEMLDQLFCERVLSLAQVVTEGNAPNVVVIEDNPADVFLIENALLQCSPTIAVTVAKDGEEAVGILEVAARRIHKPDLVVLDLNLPKRSGHEVLKSLRANPQLNFTPVAILTSSEDPGDIQQSYALGANYYLKKQNDLDSFNFTIAGLFTHCLGQKQSELSAGVRKSEAVTLRDPVMPVSDGFLS